MHGVTYKNGSDSATRINAREERMQAGRQHRQESDNYRSRTLLALRLDAAISATVVPLPQDISPLITATVPIYPAQLANKLTCHDFTT